ncbi:MAG: hypothetical protein IPL53_08325 [Ignavibacteria bacterium]|nr:hypothetical protein [Ignavibacteria bacterium]
MKYKIIEILKTFSPQEIKSFERFLDSPYFNESLKIRKFYKILERYHPHFDSPDLTEEDLSRELNPDLKFNKATFKSLFFEIGALAEKFLTIENLKGKEFLANDFLRDEFFKRKLPKFFKQNIDKTEQVLFESKDYNSIYFLDLCFLYTDKRNYLLTFVPRSNKDHNSQMISVSSDRAKALSMFFLEALRYQYDDLVSINFSFEIDKEKNFVFQLFKVIDYEKLMKFMISSGENKNYSVVLELNLYFFRLINDFSNEVNYAKCKRLLIKNAHLLRVEETYIRFIKLITYCKMKESEKNTKLDFENELFSIYKYILLKEYYKNLYDSYLPVELYRVTIKQGLQLKKYKWTLNFIKNYHSKLNPDWKMNMLHYSMAEYYFHRKKFDNALRSFQKVEMSHFLLKVDIKSLMLMTYYELGLYENALSIIDTFKHFLSNTEVLSDTLKQRYKAFILTVQKMITVKTSVKPNPMTKYLIKKNIDTDISYKQWLKEKFSELDEEIKRTA